MTCGHCEAVVKRAVKLAAPQAEIAIDRAQGRVSITAANDTEAVSSAIRDAGFEVSSIK